MTFYRRIILGSNIDNLLSYVVLTLSVVGSIDYLLRWLLYLIYNASSAI